MTKDLSIHELAEKLESDRPHAVSAQSHDKRPYQTPEGRMTDVKELIEWLNDGANALWCLDGDIGDEMRCRDAASALTRLQAENETLSRERDEARARVERAEIAGDLAWVSGMRRGYNLGISEDRDTLHREVSATQADIRHARSLLTPPREESEREP